MYLGVDRNSVFLLPAPFRETAVSFAPTVGHTTPLKLQCPTAQTMRQKLREPATCEPDALRFWWCPSLYSQKTLLNMFRALGHPPKCYFAMPKTGFGGCPGLGSTRPNIISQCPKHVFVCWSALYSQGKTKTQFEPLGYNLT